MRLPLTIALALLVPTATFSGVQGNVDVVRACLNVAKYSNKLGSLGLAIRFQGADRAISLKAEADEEFLDEAILLGVIAGENASRVLMASDGLESIVSDAIRCVNDLSCSVELQQKAALFSEKLTAACKSDFWGEH